MIKVIAFYRAPVDYAAFIRYYRDVHLPLVRRIPGLAGLEVIEVKRSLIGEFPYVVAASMSYPDRDVFRTAMQSPEQAAVAQDLERFAAGLVTAIQAETID